jgi:predicted RNase H-like HicB family nuclease
MAHVLELLGCVATGPTTEAALEATPEAIEAYRRFFARHGETLDAGPFTTRVQEHVTEGIWIGNGSPYVLFGPDLDPVGEEDMTRFVRRYELMRAALADWADAHPDDVLDAAPDSKDRTARAMLLHVLSASPSYASPMVGGMPGTSRIHTLCERGAMSLGEGLRKSGDIVAGRLRSSTPEQRSAILQRGQITRSMHNALRRTLEHEWEHLVELSRRPGGPRV